MADETYICWSYRQLHRPEGNDGYYRTTIHMQAAEVGKQRPAITACGIRRNPRLATDSPSDGWNYEVADVAPSAWVGCRRCEAAYRVYAQAQAQREVAA